MTHGMLVYIRSNPDLNEVIRGMVETATLPANTTAEQRLVRPDTRRWLSSRGGRCYLGNENVLKIPSSALFRTGDAWSVLVVESGKAYRRKVEVGQRAPFEAEIVDGIENDAQVIAHPSNEVTDGMSVTTEGG